MFIVKYKCNLNIMHNLLFITNLQVKHQILSIQIINNIFFKF